MPCLEPHLAGRGRLQVSVRVADKCAMSVTTSVANASARELQSLVEQIPAVTYIADFDGSFRLRYVSPQCKTILGYDPQEWVADPEAWVSALDPQDRDRVVAEAEACIAAARPFDFEYRMRTPDGRVVHVWEKTSFVRDAAGNPVAVNGVMLDVTDLKLALEALREQEQALEAERARYEAELERQLEERLYQASHDELTGLPNRRSFNSELARLFEQREPTALLLLDLNKFKEVNDLLGHVSGDHLLSAVASRFGRLRRSQDFVARIGGDEFAILLRSVDSIEEAIAVAERFGRALTDPFSINEKLIYVGASIGVALYPNHGTTHDELLHHADAAMYTAKGAKSGSTPLGAISIHQSPDTAGQVTSQTSAIRSAVLPPST